MVTIYELLEVEEDASKEEIEKAYSKMVLEFRQDIKFDADTNKENEMILNKLKLAYEILTNDEKRERYDKELAKKRAEELIKNISISKPETEENSEKVKEETSNIQQNQKETQEQVVPNMVQEQQINNIPQAQPVQKVYQEQPVQRKIEQNLSEQEDMLTKNEKHKIKKAAQKEFNQKLKKAKQAEEEYKAAYKKAYNDYLKKAGYKVKVPWTLKRIKRILITILILVLIVIVIWNLPPTRRMLISLYEENIVIKVLVDLVKAIIDAIFQTGEITQ